MTASAQAPEHEPGPPRADRDRGFTLVEAVIVIVLMGIVVLPVLTAVQTLIIASSTSRAAARVETAVVNATDRVLRAPKRCNYTVYVQAAVLTEGWSADRASVTHQYYVPGAMPNQPGTWQAGPPGSPGCPTASATDGLVQKLTITVRSPDGRAQRTIEVVKSDV